MSKIEQQPTQLSQKDLQFSAAQNVAQTQVDDETIFNSQLIIQSQADQIKTMQQQLAIVEVNVSSIQIEYSE